METKYYRLEWHPEQQRFHFNTGRNTPDTLGWVTIANMEPEDKISKFCALYDDITEGRKSPIFHVRAMWAMFNKMYKS